MAIKDFDYIQWASGLYLTELLPDNWNEEFSDDDLEEYLREHTWEKLEYVPVSEVWKLIEDTAWSLQKDFVPLEEAG